MKVYGARIVQARQIRKLMRYQLARLIQIETSELRHYERTHDYQECGCCPVETEMPDMLVTRIGFVLHFPYKFFLQPIQEDKAPIFFCSNRETAYCICSEKGTRLCDYVLDDESTCDSAICDACTYQIGEVDYCQAHHPIEKAKSRRVRRQHTRV